MNKQLENFSSDPKFTKSKASFLQGSDSTSYRLPQLITNNSLQVPLKQLKHSNLNQKIKLPQSKSTPLLQTSSNKHINFEKWASSIKFSHKAIKNSQKLENPKLPIQNVYNLKQLSSSSNTSSQNNDNHIFITITCEENSQKNDEIHSPNNNTKKCEIKESINPEEENLEFKNMTTEEKDQEILKMRKEIDCMKGLYKKFEEIYCNDTCSLKSKLEKRTIKYKAMEKQYRKAISQINLLKDRYKKSLEIISSNQQRYIKEISELQKKFKDDEEKNGEKVRIDEILECM
ncbi:hypothetical protein SteCoe_2765 [Stentor coeruleus]|uniref:Uncharacterized protein n=1 Tax=Stentor coeruleus TaxID=5963 RepID=A0A1R2CYS2_9CILI|nr:hypothetical protein SteCoe_2765 [Stentor coeruleus]